MHLKLLIGLVVGIAVLAWRFLFCDLPQATWVAASVGYYLLAAAVVAAGWSTLFLVKGVETTAVKLGIRQHALALFIIIWGAVFLHLHEPHLFKVTQDETTHLVVSYVMHVEKSAQAASQAHYVGDLFVPSGFYPTFRLGLFSFLVSLVHDLTGYRVSNAFVVNLLLTPFILWATWGVARKLGGPTAGCLAAVGMACSPILAQVVTSGSYDALNLFLLVAAIWATLGYIRADAAARLSWMNLSLALVVLLGLSRYESIAYTVVWAVCVLYVWWRERAVELTWLCVVAPLLLLPNFAASYLTLASEGKLYAAIKGESEPFFSLSYLPANLEALVFYLYTWGNRYTNNAVVATVGVAGFLFLLILSLSKAGKERETLRGFAVWAVFICGLYGLVLASFWASPLDDAATRFVLPFYWVLAVSAGWLGSQLPVVKSKPAITLALLFAGQWLIVAPVGSLAYGTYSLIGGRADAWVIEQASTMPRAETLYVCPFSSGLIANQFAVVPIERMQESPSRFVRALKAGLYKSVIVRQQLTLSAAGDWTPMRGSGMPAHVRLSTVTERVLAGNLMVRLSRFDGYVGPDGVLIDVNSAHPEVDLKRNFKSQDVALEYRQTLYP